MFSLLTVKASEPLVNKCLEVTLSSDMLSKIDILISKGSDLIKVGCCFLGFLTSLIIVLIFTVSWCKNA